MLVLKRLLDLHRTFFYNLFLFFYNFYFYFILLYNTVLVLPYIDMNPPRVYMSSQTWTPLPPPTPYHLSGSSPCTSPKHPVSCIKHRLAIRFLHDSIHVSMPFSQIIPPSPSPSEPKSPLYTFVSLLLSRIREFKKILMSVLHPQLLWVQSGEREFLKGSQRILMCSQGWESQHKRCWCPYLMKPGYLELGAVSKWRRWIWKKEKLGETKSRTLLSDWTELNWMLIFHTSCK